MNKNLRRSVFPSRAATAVAWAIAWGVSGQVVAAERDLDDVIVTGTKFAGDFGTKSGIPLEKVPQSVQVVGAEDIADLGAQSIGDLLRTVPSANVGYSRVGAYQSFSLKIRGFLADQMRNGIRQRYYEDVDASALSNIDRVEVLKGPSGVLYGQSAVGGILSIVTKQPDGTAGAAVSATFGSRGQKMLTGDFRAPVSDQLGLRVTGELERSGTFVDYQDLDRDNVAVTLRYAFSEDAIGHLVAEYVDRRTQRNPGLPIAGTVQPNGAGDLRRGLYLGEPSQDTLTADAPLVQAWLDWRLGGNWTLTPRFQYQEFNSQFTQIRVRAPQANLTTINRNGRWGREDDNYTIGQLDLSGSVTTGGLEHKLLAGYEYDHERSRFTQYNLTNVSPISVLAPVYAYDTVGPVRAFAFDTNFDVDGHALYLQDQLSLTSRWDVVTSVRHSWLKVWSRDVGSTTKIGTSVQNTIWQLGSTLRLADGVSLYGGYSTGFDIEGSGGGRTASGEPLKPEESEQLEAGLRVARGSLRGSFSLFQVRRINALTTDPSDPDFVINVGGQRVRGAEVQGDWAVTDELVVSAGHALLKSKITRSNDGDEGLRLGDVPKHTTTLRATWTIPAYDLTLRAGLSRVTNRLLVNGSDVVLPGYTLLDAGASFKVSRAEVDVILTNLSDRRYFTASGNAFAVMPGDPRAVQVRVGTRW